MTDLHEKILSISLDIEKLKQQAYHLAAIVESEQGTLQREADRLKAEITKVESDFRKIIYDDNGLLIKIDRLIQESNERKRVKNHIWGLWIAVIVIIIKALFELIKQ